MYNAHEQDNITAVKMAKRRFWFRVYFIFLSIIDLTKHTYLHYNYYYKRRIINYNTISPYSIPKQLLY